MAACEIMFIVMILFYMYEEVIEIYRQRLSYFRHPWNYIDWANLIICLTVVIFRIVTLATLSSFTFNSTSVDYIDFPPLGALSISEVDISAVNFFLIYFKVSDPVHTTYYNARINNIS